MILRWQCTFFNEKVQDYTFQINRRDLDERKKTHEDHTFPLSTWINGNI